MLFNFKNSVLFFTRSSFFRISIVWFFFSANEFEVVFCIFLLSLTKRVQRCNLQVSIDAKYSQIWLTYLCSFDLLKSIVESPFCPSNSLRWIEMPNHQKRLNIKDYNNKLNNPHIYLFVRSGTISKSEIMGSRRTCFRLYSKKKTTFFWKYYYLKVAFL